MFVVALRLVGFDVIATSTFENDFWSITQIDFIVMMSMSFSYIEN